jgi:hypothetical protein
MRLRGPWDLRRAALSRDRGALRFAYDDNHQHNYNNASADNHDDDNDHNYHNYHNDIDVDNKHDDILSAMRSPGRPGRLALRRRNLRCVQQRF